MSYLFNYTIGSQDRLRLTGHNTFVIWLTGLSGAGKSTIANELDVYFYNNKRHSYVLDGDSLRQGINKDLGFSEQSRTENIRRTAEIAKILLDNGIIVICSLISPMQAHRELAKSIIGDKNFIEVFVDCPLEVCVERDTKGLYKKANNNEIINFTGISMQYEKPVNPNITIHTAVVTVDQAREAIIKELGFRSCD